MTKEDKNLLLRDLCARLPYGTICEDIYGNSGILFDLVPELNSVTLKISELGSTWTTDIDKVKPYLRPMSSMTEEEIADLMVELCVCKKNIQNCGHTEIYGYTLVFQQWEKKTFFIPSEAMDYLNSHHLDYRGWIKKGMALEAPEGMYKID